MGGVAVAFTAGVFGPGFFSSPPVHVALIVGGVVAVVSGIVGTFTVMRGQSFAGHALSDVGTAGGSAAFLLGVSPLFGFVAMNVAAAGVMEMIGIRRPRGRDLATGIVLGAALGLAAAFLFLGTTDTNTTGATVNVLFGSVFTLSASIVPVIAIFSGVALALIALLYRPLVLSALSSDLAAARGVPVRLVGLGYLLALALAVSLSAVTIGAILSTALLIGPPAAALRLTKRTGWGIVASCVIGLVATWGGVLLSYDSYYWPPTHQGWPVSFFVVTLVFAFYVLAGQLTKATKAGT
jgi:zinc/manganese transport system permease protein